MNKLFTFFNRFYQGENVALSSLNALRSPLLLGARAYIAYVFFISGLAKIKDWGTTLELFRSEFQVPLLSPGLAAVLGTAGELVLPVLLVLGLFGRFAALGLFVVNIVAVISLADIAPAALQQHIFWAWLLAFIAVMGGGKWAVDCLIKGKVNPQ